MTLKVGQIIETPSPEDFWVVTKLYNNGDYCDLGDIRTGYIIEFTDIAFTIGRNDPLLKLTNRVLTKLELTIFFPNTV